MSNRAAVLVIDDEPGIRDMLAYELSMEGFDVETAESGMAAVEAVKRRKFDLAVTDLKMPGMDGVATVEALRSLDPDIEVIVATGYASVETAVACMKRGAYDYIQKPYDLAELKLLLERATQKSHLQSVVALYEASRALMSTLNHADLVQLVVTLAQRVLRADNIGLLLRNKEEKGFTIHRLTEEVLPGDSLLVQLAQRVTQEGTPLRLPAPSILMVPSPGKNKDYGSALAYPLVARTRSLGALVALRHSKSPEFSPSELQKGTVFASQLAVSLENARLYDELAQKVSELVRTREQLVHAEKLALAGQLAGAVAHEVNNPLAFVRSNLNALRDYSSMVGGLWLAAKSAATYLRSQSSAAAQEHALALSTVGGGEERTESLIREIAEVIDETLEGVKRIAELVAGFAWIAEPKGQASPEQVDVNEVIQECVNTLALPNKQTGYRIHFEAQPALALVTREDLRSALLNLMAFLSAPERKRATGHGLLTIRTSSERGLPSVVLTDETLLLSKEERSRIFDPRVEVDSAGRTMRLNIALALTYQMLRRNGADVTTTIAETHGITFQIALKPAPDES
jgi:DNA-binding response OmpR family regulator